MSRKIAGVAPARTTVAAAGLLLAAGLAACGSGSGSTGSSGPSFTYWTSQWQPAEIAAVDTAFARAHPGMHAQGQYIASSDEYLPKVITAVKSGTQPTVLFLQNWNNFLFPLIAVNTTNMEVISQGVSVFQSQFTAQYNLTTAAALIAIVPVLAVAVTAQRHIIEGITLGALD